MERNISMKAMIILNY